MPLPSSSSHPLYLHTLQPEPWQTTHCSSSSSDGSVNGKWWGRHCRAEPAPKNERAKYSRVPLRSLTAIPSSMQRPSTWWNIGMWVAS